MENKQPNFRLLRADEIELRIGREYYNPATRTGFITLLAYKNARVDANILDETVGTTGWACEHKEIKGKDFCRVSILSGETGTWVYKEDCGSEGNFEKEKSESTDAFKRACFLWGIGRELYTLPEIKINLSSEDFNHEKKCAVFGIASQFRIDRLSSVIEPSGKKVITELVLTRNGSVVYRLSTNQKAGDKNSPTLESSSLKNTSDTRREALLKTLTEKYKVDIESMVNYYRQFDSNINTVEDLTVYHLTDALAKKSKRVA